jgi:hypothetical protein
VVLVPPAAENEEADESAAGPEDAPA